jgi:hypothetical protein
MPRLFTDSASLAFFLIAALASPFLTYLVARRQAQTRERQTDLKAGQVNADTYGKIVEDAVNLKKQFQGDYEALRQRLEDQDSQILVLRQRVLTLEAENHNLRLQIMAAGLASVSIAPPPPITPPAEAAPATQPLEPAKRGETRRGETRGEPRSGPRATTRQAAAIPTPNRARPTRPKSKRRLDA